MDKNLPLTLLFHHSTSLNPTYKQVASSITNALLSHDYFFDKNKDATFGLWFDSPYLQQTLFHAANLEFLSDSSIHFNPLQFAGSILPAITSQIARKIPQIDGIFTHCGLPFISKCIDFSLSPFSHAIIITVSRGIDFNEGFADIICMKKNGAGKPFAIYFTSKEITNGSRLQFDENSNYFLTKKFCTFAGKDSIILDGSYTVTHSQFPFMEMCRVHDKFNKPLLLYDRQYNKTDIITLQKG